MLELLLCDADGFENVEPALCRCQNNARELSVPVSLPDVAHALVDEQQLRRDLALQRRRRCSGGFGICFNSHVPN
jgi:hypothetical protein